MDRIIRELRLNDLPELIDIERRAFTHPWPPEAFDENLLPNSWVILVEDKLVGYVLYHVFEDEAVILNIAIDPDYQGLSHGSHLLQQTLDMLESEGKRRIFLDVRETNLTALNVYKKLGFTEIGIRKDYYNNPIENAIMMGRFHT